MVVMFKSFASYESLFGQIVVKRDLTVAEFRQFTLRYELTERNITSYMIKA